MLETLDFSQPKMKKEEYKLQYKPLIEKLVILQQKARSKGIGLVVLFEGWGGAGKGSRISDLMYELDARATSVHVTPDFDVDAAKTFKGASWGVSDFYPVMQEFWKGLGERGTISFYDRGWYTAAIDQVLYSFIEEEKKDKGHDDHKKKSSKIALLEESAARARDKFHGDIVGSYCNISNNFEKMLVDDGYIVIKLFVHVSKETQEKRLKKLHKNPSTSWRVSKEKLRQVKHYDRALKLYDQLLEMTNFSFAPWTLVNGEDRRVANIQVAKALVDSIEYALEHDKNAADREALKKASENSARASEATAEEYFAIGEDASNEELLKAAKAEAALQHSQAPKASRFVVPAGYPQINHSLPKPAIESKEEYKKLLKAEQARFNALELEMYKKRIPLVLMYEGWDAAGKGGNIKRVAQAIDARAYTIFTSPAPTKPELMHPHLWRYWIRLPKAGHVGIYDRSWYGRVLVERVEGFASPEQWGRAYDEINAFEYELVQWGAILLKFWVDITPEEQYRRFKAREENPQKTWKITEEDWRNRGKYPQYKQAVDDMLRLTSTTFAPWIILESENKLYARIQALRAINEALEKRMH